MSDSSLGDSSLSDTPLAGPSGESLPRGAHATSGPQVHVVTIVAAIVAAVAFGLIVLSGELHVAWLASSANLLEAVFWLGLIGIAVGQYTKLDAARARLMALRGGLMFVSLAVMAAPAEFATRFAFRDVRSSVDGGYFARRALPTRTNNLGFRDVNVGAKAPDRYRIAVIGDSFTWGQGLTEDQRFSDLLGQYLGPRYEVLNFGTPGHGMREHLEVLDQVLTLKPDYVLLQLYVNFFEAPDMVRPAGWPLLPPPVHGWFMEKSALYCLMANQWIHLQEQTGIVEGYAQYMDRHLRDPAAKDSLEPFEMLRDFIGRARAAGVPVAIVMFPNTLYPDSTYPFDYLHDRLHGACAEQKIPCVDLRSTFARFPDPRVLWVNRFDPHPNAIANQRAGAVLLNALGPSWRSTGG